MSDNAPNKANTAKVDHLRKIRIIAKQIGVGAVNQAFNTSFKMPDLDEESPKSLEKQEATVFSAPPSAQKSHNNSYATEEQIEAEKARIARSAGLPPIRLFNNHLPMVDLPKDTTSNEYDGQQTNQSHSNTPGHDDAPRHHQT